MAGPAEIRERDMGRCVRCGSLDALQAHHRVRRSQGGQDSFPGQVALCGPCHHWVHHNVAEARAGGWLLRPWEDPREVPVAHWCWPAGPVWLNDDGTVSLAR